MIFADLQLARRIEAAEAANAGGCTAIHPEAATLEVAGGCAVFVGAESPLSHATGIGLGGPVAESELDRLEAFFRSRGARVSIELCPLADPGLLETLGKRGYCITEFNNVLVKRLAGTTVVLTPRVRLALGAVPRNILWMVLREGLGLALTGTALGLPVVWLGSKYIQSELSQTKALEPA